MKRPTIPRPSLKTLAWLAAMALAAGLLASSLLTLRLASGEIARFEEQLARAEARRDDARGKLVAAGRALPAIAVTAERPVALALRQLLDQVASPRAQIAQLHIGEVRRESAVALASFDLTARLGAAEVERWIGVLEGSIGLILTHVQARQEMPGNSSGPSLVMLSGDVLVDDARQP